MLWSSMMKGEYYKSMKLTDGLKAIFKEDLEKFLALPGDV